MNLVESHPPKISVGIREMCKADLKSVVRIEKNTVGDRWSMPEFKKRCRGDDKYLAIVATNDEEVLGYLAYRRVIPRTGNAVGGWKIIIDRMAVDKEYRRHGIGSQMLWAITDRNCGIMGFDGVVARVSERELGQQLFLKGCAFNWTHADKPDDGGDDEWVFQLTIGEGE